MPSRVCSTGRTPEGNFKAWSALSELFQMQFLTCFQVLAEVLRVSVCPVTSELTLDCPQARELAPAPELSRALLSLNDVFDSCPCSHDSNQTVFPFLVFSTVACGFSDYKAGFGGRFGVQSERQDSCAVGFDYKERLAKHESQQGIVAHQPRPLPPASPPGAATSSTDFMGSAFSVARAHLSGHVGVLNPFL